jgi:CSLREA domain-containing protein
MSRPTRVRIWILAGVLAPLLAALPVAFAFPASSSGWLSRPGISGDAEATEYYTTISAPPTLSDWKSAYGFNGSNDTVAIYYNAGDLGFGREMHCRKSGADVACYVVNHGLGAGGPVQPSIKDAVANQNILPTVAMVYLNALNGSPNDVRFYIYAPGSGVLVNGVALDSEGDKFAPNMCLACHGGFYDAVSNAVIGGNFLPFDTESFRYSPQPGYTLADQQEEFRQLNSMVRDTNPTTAITELIDGWYAATRGVTVSGSTPNPNFVTSGYAGDSALYNNIFKPYCRSCHIAQVGYAFTTPTQLLTWTVSSNANTGYAVFHVFDMPHAELTSHNFWNSPAPADLANRGGWSYRVTKTADTNDGACNSDCSLREAIVAANAGLPAPVYKNIITFDVDGTFTLTQAGADENAALTGDLDISADVILLGNGPERTIIDGGGIDRVFHVANGAGAVIQNVTIQNGQVNGPGGGILNDGSRLTLVNSVVRNNLVSPNNDGAGVANLNGAITQISNSTLGPDNVSSDQGGGLFNQDSTVTLDNSTVSGNSGAAGGGIFNTGTTSSTVSASTIVGNSAASGGGIANSSPAAIFVRNTIIAGNLGGPSSRDCSNSGAFNSQGYNLVGENGSANGCPTVSTDLVVAGPVNAALDPDLSGASGRTPYHALVRGGPAVDAIPPGGNCTLPAYDQLNLARPQDGDANATLACDIGAQEVPAERLVFLPLVIRSP